MKFEIRNQNAAKRHQPSILLSEKTVQFERLGAPDAPVPRILLKGVSLKFFEFNHFSSGGDGWLMSLRSVLISNFEFSS